jgi:hypothetical protein
MLQFDYPSQDVPQGPLLVSSDHGMESVARWNQTQNSKRKRDEMVSDPDFQVDPAATPDEGFTTTQAPPPKRRQGRPPKTAPTPLSNAAIDLEEMKRRAHESGMTYSQLQNDLKRNKSSKVNTGTGEIKSRKRWTIEETGTLINLITQYGVSWAQIKKFDEANGNILADRDQVNLKDKARNIKFDILKMRQPLPPNFDLVTLSATMKAKLEAMHNDEPATQADIPQPATETNIGHLPLPYQQPSPGRPEEEEEPAFETQEPTEGQ